MENKFGLNKINILYANLALLLDHSTLVTTASSLSNLSALLPPSPGSLTTGVYSLATRIVILSNFGTIYIPILMSNTDRFPLGKEAFNRRVSQYLI